MDELARESKLACECVLAYHKALVQVAKDRVHGSYVKNAKLDDLYEKMYDQVLKLEEATGGDMTRRDLTDNVIAIIFDGNLILSNACSSIILDAEGFAQLVLCMESGGRLVSRVGSAMAEPANHRIYVITISNSDEYPIWISDAVYRNLLAFVAEHLPGWIDPAWTEVSG